MNEPDKEEPRRTLIEDFDPLNDGFGFRVKWIYRTYSAEVSIWDVIQLSGEEKLFRKDDMSSSTCRFSDNPVVYLTGFLRWDGCADIDQHHVHWCGPTYYKKHIRLLCYLYGRSHELMGRVPEEEWA